MLFTVVSELVLSGLNQSVANNAPPCDRVSRRVAFRCRIDTEWRKIVATRALASVSSEGRREHGVAQDKAAAILAALGGGDNVVEIEPCITRLRCEVEDGSKIDEVALKAAGAHGVLRQGNVVQVVVGPEADTLAGDIEDLV